MVKTRASEAEALFAECDVDGTGFLEIDDIQRAQFRLELGQASDEDIKRFFDVLDSDPVTPHVGYVQLELARQLSISRGVSRETFVQAMSLLTTDQMQSCSTLMRRGASMQRLRRNVDLGGETRTRSALTPIDTRQRWATMLQSPPQQQQQQQQQQQPTNDPLNSISDAMTRMLEEAKFAIASTESSESVVPASTSAAALIGGTATGASYSSSSQSAPGSPSKGLIAAGLSLLRTNRTKRSGSNELAPAGSKDGDDDDIGQLVAAYANDGGTDAGGEDDKLLLELSSKSKLDPEVLGAVQGRIALLDREKRLTREQLEEAQRKNQKLERRIGEIDEELFALQQENIRLKKRCFEAQESLFEANNNVDNVQHQLNVRQEEVAKFKRQVRDLELERASLMDQHQAKLACFELAAQQSQQNEETQRSRLQKLDDSLLTIQDELKTEKSNLSAMLEQLREGMLDSSDAQSAAIVQQSRDLDAARAESESLRRELEQVKGKGKTIGVTTTTGHRSGSLSSSSSSSPDKFEQLQSVVAAMTQEIAQLQAANGDLRKHNNHYLSVLSQRQLEAADKDTSPTTLTTQRAALATAIDQASTAELQQRIVSLADDNRQYRNYMDSLLAKIMTREDLMYLLRRE